MIGRAIEAGRKVAGVFLRHLLSALGEAIDVLDPLPPRKKPLRSIRLTDDILFRLAEVGHEALRRLAEKRNARGMDVAPLRPFEELSREEQALLQKQVRSLFMHLPPLPESGWDKEEMEVFARAVVPVADEIKRELNRKADDQQVPPSQTAN